MLYLVKIEPNLFLLAVTPVEPWVIKVSLEVPVGRSAVEDQRAVRDGAGESRPTHVGGGRGRWKFQGIRGGNRWSREGFTLGGGNVSGHGTLGHAFMGVARHD